MICFYLTTVRAQRVMINLAALILFLVLRSLRISGQVICRMRWRSLRVLCWRLRYLMVKIKSLDPGSVFPPPLISFLWMSTSSIFFDGGFLD